LLDTLPAGVGELSGKGVSSVKLTAAEVVFPGVICVV
jgi:hypothetical protein